MLFTPLIDYSGYEHVLNAMPCFVHPVSGNLYGVAIEKAAGIHQNLSVYRARPGNPARELVFRFLGGGVDAQSQIAAGGCVILQDGSLQVWAAADPAGGTPITKTGFVGGYWEPIPNVDLPWSAGGSGSTLFPAVRTTPAWEDRRLTGGALVDVPTVFGVPSAPIYKIRFVAIADTPDIRVRAGTETSPYFVTLNTQFAGRAIMTTGETPGPHIYVSVVDGAGQPATARVWLQLCGFST